MARAKRTDDNHKQIVRLFRALGCLVYDTSAVGGGFTDIIIQRTNSATGFIETKLVEIKDGSKSPSRQRLTPDQVKFHGIWRCYIVASSDDVYKLLGIRRT